MDAYERLLGDAMIGDATLFARQDVVEAAWAIVDPVIHGAEPAVRVRARHLGPAGGRRASSPTSAAGTPRRPRRSAPCALRGGGGEPASRHTLREVTP